MGKFQSKNWLNLSIFILASFALCQVLFGEPIKVIGQIESIYLQRASMRILEIPGDASGTSPLKIGQRVSFSIPIQKTGKKKGFEEKLEFGKIYEIDLEGSMTTEYTSSMTEEPAKAEPASDSRKVFFWTGSNIKRVRNINKYKVDEPPEKGKKSKGRKDRRKKDQEGDKIWTQQETVKGVVLVKDKRLYIKEEHLKPKDKGLDVISDEWYEKLKPYAGKVVIVNGTTKRVSAASGTIDINCLIKISPK